jgi:hypothetical protein
MKRASLILVAALCGCGDYNFTAVPKCGKGQVLSGDGKSLTCVDVGSAGGMSPDGGGGGGDVDMRTPVTSQDMATAPGLMVPACGPGSCLTGDNAGQLSCVDITTNNQNIQMLQTEIASLTNRVTALENNMKQGGGGGSGMFVGVTKATTVGRIVHAGADIGLASAAAYCADEFSVGAHMCTNYELYLSVASGKITANNTITPAAWVYFPAWQTPLGQAEQPLAGMGDNCASYTYPTAHRKWSGLAVEWKTNSQGDATAFWWHGGAEALCNVARSIACCK